MMEICNRVIQLNNKSTLLNIINIPLNLYDWINYNHKFVTVMRGLNFINRFHE